MGVEVYVKTRADLEKSQKKIKDLQNNKRSELKTYKQEMLKVKNIYKVSKGIIRLFDLKKF